MAINPIECSLPSWPPPCPFHIPISILSAEILILIHISIVVRAAYLKARKGKNSRHSCGLGGIMAKTLTKKKKNAVTANVLL